MPLDLDLSQLTGRFPGDAEQIVATPVRPRGRGAATALRGTADGTVGHTAGLCHPNLLSGYLRRNMVASCMPDGLWSILEHGQSSLV
jgi:hypothetical protein